MRRNILPRAVIQAAWRRMLGVDEATITYAPLIRGSWAVRFELRARSLTIEVPVVDLYLSTSAFSEKYITKVVALFREANVPGVNPGPENLSVGSRSAVETEKQNATR